MITMSARLAPSCCFSFVFLISWILLLLFLLHSVRLLCVWNRFRICQTLNEVTCEETNPTSPETQVGRRVWDPAPDFLIRDTISFIMVHPFIIIIIILMIFLILFQGKIREEESSIRTHPHSTGVSPSKEWKSSTLPLFHHHHHHLLLRPHTPDFLTTEGFRKLGLGPQPPGPVSVPRPGIVSAVSVQPDFREFQPFQSPVRVGGVQEWTEESEILKDLNPFRVLRSPQAIRIGGRRG